MNNATVPPVFTPLESLFLFQSLRKHGLGFTSFVRIAEELKNNALVREQETYNVARLTAESLQDLFLRLLRDELKREAEIAEKNAAGGALSPNSKKRKLQSPPLPSLHEAASEHYEKLPILIDRLYARYRDGIVEQIRREEASLETLQTEIEQIKSGAWDERIAKEKQQVQQQQQQQKPLSRNGTPTPGEQRAGKAPPNGQTVPTPGVSPRLPPQGAPQRSATPVQQLNSGQHAPANVSSPLHPNARPASAAPPVSIQDPRKPPNGASPVLQPPQAATAVPPRPPPVASQPPAAETSQVDPTARAATPGQAQPGQPQPQTPLKWEPIYQGPRTQPIKGAARPSPELRHPSAPQPPQQPHPLHNVHPQQPSSAGAQRQPTPSNFQPPRAQVPAHGAQQQTSSSVLVPPQATPQIPPRLQTLPPNVAPDGSGQKPQQQAQPARRPPSIPPATGQSPVLPQQYSQPSQTPIRPPVGVHPNTSAPPAHLAQQQPGSQVHPAYGAQQPALPATPLAKQQSYGQAHNQAQHPAAIPAQQRLNLQTGRAPSTPHLAQHSPLAGTPVGLKASPATTRGSATQWKPVATPSTPRFETLNPFDVTLQSPAQEPLSPPLKPVDLPQATSKASGKKAQKTETPIPTPRGRGRPSRGATQPSTPVAGPSRSDEMSLDQEAPARIIKNEEATPRALDDTGDAGDTTADESVSSKALKSRLGEKRKREDSVDTGPTPVPQSHVLWTRAFPKISFGALEQVIGHRHANMFANPVKDRDAPRYSDIVLRPQDLKGIKAAITRGHKAAMAAAAALPEGSDSGASSIWLPVSVDLVPPRGIINIHQLEKELVHMFSNAIMYAPDPDRGLGSRFKRIRRGGSDDGGGDVLGYEVDENGIVKQTRSMFTEVEKLMDELRNQMERTAPALINTSRSVSMAAGEASGVEEEVDEPTGDSEPTGYGTVKRRRRG